MKRTLAALYLIVLHLVVAAALIKTDLIDRAGLRLGLLTPPEAPIISTMREVHRQMDASVPDGATIFLGDSITMALATAAVAPRSVNYGIGHQRSDQLIESMALYKSMSRASRVVVTIGTNDILQGQHQGIAARYRMLLDSVPRAVPVVMSSPPPTTHLTTEIVRAVTLAAEDACAARSNCRFIDTTELLAEVPGQGLLTDGIHLSEAGYSAWIQALKNAIAGTKSPAPGDHTAPSSRRRTCPSQRAKAPAASGQSLRFHGCRQPQ